MRTLTGPLVFCLSAFLLVAAQIAPAQDEAFDLRIDGLNGRVKRVEEHKASVKFENYLPKEGRRERYRTMIFDKKGRKTYEWTKISGLDPFEAFYYYKDDKRYRRTVRPGVMVGASKPIESHSFSIFQFDKTSNTLFEKVYPGREDEKQKQTQGWTFRFGPDGCLLEANLLSASEKPVVRKQYIYSGGCLLKEIRIGPLLPNARVQSIKYEYEMGDNGNWKKQTAVNTFADKDATTKTEVTYRKIEYYR